MTPEFKFISISFVSINDETIQQVAARCNVTEERVRAFLADKSDQDETLTRAFLFFGVGPIGKTLP